MRPKLIYCLFKPSASACPAQPGELLQKLLSVTKPTGHLSHIINAGTSDDVMQSATKAHAEGKGPSVSATFVQPSGKQLQEVGAMSMSTRGRVCITAATAGC